MGVKGFTGDSLPLVPGTLYGLRAFTLDTGTVSLRGVSYPDRWSDGENVAVCQDRKNRHAPHSMADCDHGYWSYFGTGNDYMTPMRAAAIIEGYGEVIIGEEGFRSEKARIKAVVLPEEKILFGTQKIRNLIGMVLAAAFLYASILALPTFIYFMLEEFMHQSTGNLFFSILLMAIALMAGVAGAKDMVLIAPALLMDHFYYKKEMRKQAKKEAMKSPRTKTAIRTKTMGRMYREFLAAFSTAYPDVKIYPDLPSMLKDYQKHLGQQQQILKPSSN